jgi:hypothetical protein
MSEAQQAKQVLFVGQEPETVDFADPALPPSHTHYRENPK